MASTPNFMSQALSLVTLMGQVDAGQATPQVWEDHLFVVLEELQEHVVAHDILPSTLVAAGLVTSFTEFFVQSLEAMSEGTGVPAGLLYLETLQRANDQSPLRGPVRGAMALGLATLGRNILDDEDQEVSIRAAYVTETLGSLLEDPSTTAEVIHLVTRYFSTFLGIMAEAQDTTAEVILQTMARSAATLD